MARLSLAQWGSVRSTWEASPKPGFAWLTVESGGPWSVSREAVRVRALRENWRKLPSLAESVQQDDDRDLPGAAEDDEVDGRLGKGKSGAGLTQQPEADQRSVGVTELDDSQRLELRDRHRREWNSVARGLIYETAREARKATGLNKGKMMKLVVDALRVLHQAEAAAHGLAVLDVDWDSLSAEQLRAIYEEGKLPT